LWQFDNIVEGQIDNEVAKAIEKAHTYHLNLQNYRSNLSAEQIKDWQEVLKGVEIKNGSKIDKRYFELQKAEPKVALHILASFDPKDALQMDIAREFLSKLDKEVLEKEEKLKKLEEILRKGFQYPLAKLGMLLKEKSNNLVKINKNEEYKEITLKLYGQGMTERRVAKGEEIKFDSCQLLEENDIITSIHQFRNGCFVAVPKDFSGAIASKNFLVYSVDQTEVNPLYLQYVVTSKDQIKKYQGESQGGATPIYPRKDILEVQIPLPPLEVQNEIVEKIEKQKQIIEGADRILNSWEPYINDSPNKKPLKKYVVDSLYGISSPLNTEGKYPVLRMNNLDTQGNWYLDDLKYIDDEIKEERKLKIGDFLFNRTNSKELVGKSGVVDFDFSGTWAGYLIRLRFNQDLSPYYLKYLFAQKKYRDYFSSIGKQAEGQVNINVDELTQTMIDWYPIETQRQIVEKLDKQMQALEGVRLLKSEAEKRIEEILAGVWGE